MRILGIESSCDETAVAIVGHDRRVYANVVLSQPVHQDYGGVVPELAARAHLQALPHLISQALDQAQCTLDQIDAFAATAGPGLMGGLITGLTTAKTLAARFQKPFIAVNHLEAHALTARLDPGIAFPYLLLLTSGGHCMTVMCHDFGRYEVLGQTLDDAAGEAFDKVAKMLHLDYPGGPELEKLARDGDPKRFAFAPPMRGHADLNFSFSGLKTAVRMKIQSLGNLDLQAKADIAAAFQTAVLDSIYDRLARTLQALPQIPPLVMAGGVAANQALRTRLTMLMAQHDQALIAPPPKLCTDNAAMIAWCGIEHLTRRHRSSLDFAPRARWPLDSL